jgi:hypothetical protein
MCGTVYLVIRSALVTEPDDVVHSLSKLVQGLTVHQRGRRVVDQRRDRAVGVDGGDAVAHAVFVGDVDGRNISRPAARMPSTFFSPLSTERPLNTTAPSAADISAMVRPMQRVDR